MEALSPGVLKRCTGGACADKVQGADMRYDGYAEVLRF